MVNFPGGLDWAGKIELKWSNILRVEVGQDNFVMYYQKNGREKHKKVSLRWVEKKEMLLSILEIECKKNEITWTEPKSIVS